MATAEQAAVVRKLDLLRRAAEPDGRLGRALDREGARMDEQLASLRRVYRPVSELRAIWAAVVARDRKMVWVETALKGLEDEYFRRLLAAVLRGDMTVGESVAHLRIPRRAFRHYGRERRARKDAIVAAATDLEAAVRMTRWLGPPGRASPETFYEDCAQLRRSLNKSIDDHKRE